MSNIGNPFVTDTIPTINDNSNSVLVQKVATIDNVPSINSAGVPILRSTLEYVVPSNISSSANAFAVSLLQIKNIQKMDVEKFAQIIPNIETTKDLSIGGTNLPTDTSAVASVLPMIAKGSGQDGTYLMNDFFGSMSGIPYDCVNTQVSISQVNTLNLEAIYDSMISLLSGPGPYNSELQTLIDSANILLQNIYNNNLPQATSLNTLYSSLGTQLTIEQNARQSVLPNSDDSFTSQYPATAISFVDMVPVFALETEAGQSAQTLEKIANINNVYGQSLVGMMREARNSTRLGLAGGELDNNISSVLSQASTTSLGTASSTSTQSLTPTSTTGTTLTTSDGIVIDKVTGAPTTLGSLAGTPYQELVPTNLDVFTITPTITPSFYTTTQATNEVDLCNCDCWQN